MNLWLSQQFHRNYNHYDGTHKITYMLHSKLLVKAEEHTEVKNHKIFLDLASIAGPEVIISHHYCYLALWATT